MYIGRRFTARLKLNHCKILILDGVSHRNKDIVTIKFNTDLLHNCF